MAKKSLVIVESPAKAKTINRYLGDGFIVKSSAGHVKDLPLKKLGVDVNKGFTPEYEVVKDKVPVIKDLKSLSRKSDKVYLAADPDREGEAICWHIHQELDCDDELVFRVLFTEITKSGIERGMSEPMSIDMNKVNAQQARRVLDRLVGYQISPLLSQKVRQGLSAGRVQSVALRMICERELAIREFVPEEYWTITALLKTKDGEEFKAELIKIGDKAVKISNREEAKEIYDRIMKEGTVLVSDIKKVEKKQPPPPPLITSTLQQVASADLRLAARLTMELAQSLYEGIDLKEAGLVGLITYMRTDSTRVADTALTSVRDLIGETFGSDYVPSKPNVYKSPRGAQEAHEAIRPTDVFIRPGEIEGLLSKDQFRVYRLIWGFFVASQMKPAIFDRTTALFKVRDFTFKAQGSVRTFPGYQKVHEEMNHHKKPEKDVMLPRFDKGDKLDLKSLEKKQHFTEPPPRYAESSLIKALVEAGIGRPSTYAMILNTIRMREYVQMEKRSFKATPLGLLVNRLLIANFPQVMDINFSAGMEEQLDAVEEGKLDWQEAIGRFYEDFSKAVKHAEKNMTVPREETEYLCDQCGAKMLLRLRRSKGNAWYLSCGNHPKCKATKDVRYDTLGNLKVVEPKKSKTLCDKCGREMVLKQSRYGSFLACSGYPDCRNTKPVRMDERTGEMVVVDMEEVDETCPNCRSKLVIKLGRSGRFLACSAYPKCTFTKSISIGVACPKDGCGGYVTEKRTRKGKIFYGCSNYPNCKFAVWDKPVAQKCRQCGSLMVAKYERGADQPSYLCSRKDCGYRTSDVREEKELKETS
ncbi:MAG: type I DNA topoisomerase [Candidatus Coatesbacteria bacterium]|nr:type I DNA topoisomerase [Candidatus Coatesbacteria bacterium]